MRLLLALILFGANLVWADQPLRLLVPVAPGGGADIVARIVAQNMMQQWGHTVVVDNRGGAGGAVAFNLLLQSPRDGRTVILMSNGEQEEIFARNALRELHTVARQPVTVSVISALGVKNLAEMIVYAQKNLDQLRYGTGGVGSPLHMAAREFERTHGVILNHVPYKGGAAAILPMLSQETHMVFMGIAPMLGYRFHDKIKILAVTGTHRSPLAPEIPTFREQGSAYDYHIWYSIVAREPIPQHMQKLWIDAVRSIDPGEFSKLNIDKWTTTRNKK
jgi:tripartite-type tricarboxylate transporter receptor subunit TctC